MNPGEKNQPNKETPDTIFELLELELDSIYEDIRKKKEIIKDPSTTYSQLYEILKDITKLYKNHYGIVYKSLSQEILEHPNFNMESYLEEFANS